MVDFSVPFNASFANAFPAAWKVQAPAVLGVLTPEMMREGVGIGNQAADDEAIRLAVAALQDGWALSFPNTYWTAGNIQYTGKRSFIGHGRSGGVKLIGGLTVKGVFIPASWVTTTEADMQAVAQATKFRPTFYEMSVDCSSDLGSVCEGGIVFSSSEGEYIGNRVINASGVGILGTPFNSAGFTQTSGNMLQNKIMHNRISGSGVGGIRTDDGQNETRITDGICSHNSITNGSEAAIRIDAAQGWGITDNQTSATLHGIFCLKANHTTITSNRINAYGNKTTTGNRYGIFAGGLTTSQSMTLASGNTIEANYNATAGAGTSKWISVGFTDRSPASGKKVVHIGPNTHSFTGFSGTTGKTSGVEQISGAGGDDALNGLISGNSFVSDQNINGSMTDTPIVLLGAAHIRSIINQNGQSVLN